MNILLDTHVIIWTLTDDKRFTKEAKECLLDINNNIYFSPISIWEIELKHETHPTQLKFNGSIILEYLESGGYIECPLISKQILKLEELSAIKNVSHTDPFDRLLLAHAMSNGFYFMTHDDKFKNYKYDKLILI